MRPVTVSKTGAGSTAAVPMNIYATPFNVGFGVVVSGTVNYTVQHTFDNPQTAASLTWFDHPTVAAQATSQDGNYAFPVMAIRLTVNSGGGTATMTVIQSGVI